MAGIVHIPWYATGFRGDKLADALAEISPVALRYGARSHAVYRYNDDRYKFLQTAEFEHKRDFERYWNGPEFTDFRMVYSSFYQVPMLPHWLEVVAHGQRKGEPIIRTETIEQG
jgi:hypothetical protein